MDIHKLKRGSFAKTVITSIVLSLAIVMITAMIGRAVINVRSALFGPIPNSFTPISLFEEHLPGETIIELETLRESAGREQYDYLVRAKNGSGLIRSYLVQVIRGEDRQWHLKDRPELLREEPRVSTFVGDMLNALPAQAKEESPPTTSPPVHE